MNMSHSPIMTCPLRNHLQSIIQNILLHTVYYSNTCKSIHFIPGGGGTRLSSGRGGGGGAAGVWKPDPVAMRSAHKKYTPVIIYLTKNLHIYMIPCPTMRTSNRPCHNGVRWADKQKKKKKKGHRLPDRLNRYPVINTVGREITNRTDLDTLF